jgi:hypothetical protein
MKTKILFVTALVFMAHFSKAQEVIIKGTLRCLNNNGVATSTRGATNIVVIPSFNPSASVATTTDPQGFFQISPGWKATDLIDKEVTLYIITKCSNCKKLQRVFITQDLDKRNTDPTKLYVTVKNWKVLENCEKIELPDILSEQLLDSAHRLPPQTITGKAPGSQAMASAGFLNLFQKLLTAAIVQPATGLFVAHKLNPGKIKYGEFLQASAVTNTDNTGFNFSPSRNLSEAVFFNSAAIAKSPMANNISLLTNFKNNVKFSAFHKISTKLYMALGGIYTKQDEFRSVEYIGSFPVDDPITKTGRPAETLKEFAAFISAAYNINYKLSVGVTAKSTWQQFTKPVSLFIAQNDTAVTNTFTDDTTKLNRFDADISINYAITNFLQAGFTVMNVAGTELYGDLYIKDSVKPIYKNQRSFGLGVCYKNERLNVGVDALYAGNEFYDASVGVNYVPFNNSLIAAGYAFKQKSFSVSFRFKSFKIAYIDDNHLMVNDVKVGQSKVFNGKIYSGFVFEF